MIVSSILRADRWHVLLCRPKVETAIGLWRQGSIETRIGMSLLGLMVIVVMRRLMIEMRRVRSLWWRKFRLIRRACLALSSLNHPTVVADLRSHLTICIIHIKRGTLTTQYRKCYKSTTKSMVHQLAFPVFGYLNAKAQG